MLIKHKKKITAGLETESASVSVQADSLTGSHNGIF